MARHLITSAIPYINGIKHLGNLVGSQLPADLYARYLRGRGHEVLFLCATDEHGTPAELAAAKAGKPVADYCAEMHDVQAEIAKGFKLSFDHFGRSSSPQNHALTQAFAGRLAEMGLIREVVEEQVYSNADGRFLPDRYIEGTCPNCGSDSACGDQCDNCTKQLDPTDLIDARSTISGSTDLEVRETKHLYLRQSELKGDIADWIGSKVDWPILTTSIAKKWLTDGDGLQDRGITRDLDWGIPVKKGADDYLTKPFNLEELLLRVSKLIEKNQKLQDRTLLNDQYQFGANQIDFKAQQATGVEGKIIELSKKETMLLKLLIENKNEVVTRERILNIVWGYQVYPTTRTIDNFILGFRKYFEPDSRNPRYFQSVRGVGYKFTEEY